MIIERFPEIQNLTVDDQWQLYTELGNLLFVDEPITDLGLIRELDRRQEEYHANPDTGKSWAEVRAQLRAKYSQPSRE